MSDAPRVAVVGAGIAGLAAAYELTKHGVTPVVFDADVRPGGKVRTERFADVLIDTGPDAFLARRPEAVELCEELGLRPKLESPAATHAYVYARGRLRSLPAGLVLGVPTDPVALARSGILSGWAVARAALEPYLPGEPLGDDDALGAVTRRRFGNEVTNKLVDPLLGGINAGDVDQLSIDLVAPQIAAAARTDRSLTKALKGAPKPPSTSDPVFFTIPGGMETLVDALLKAVTAAGGEVRRNDAVTRISPSEIGHEVASRSGTTDVQGVVLATPSYVSAPLLEPVAPGVASTLSSIPYASVCMVLLSYDERDMGRPLDASGYLVPRSEGLLITAASWASSKWSHLAKAGRVLVRASAGRFGDDRAMQLGDDELVRRVHRDLVTTMQVRSEPIESQVVRWQDAFPQYPPGHRRRIDAALAGLPPGIALAGASLRGVGLPACIGTGRDAARAVAATIGYTGP